MPEASAIFSSVLVICIMAALLQKFDGCELTQWRFPMTLNALIALLVTILWMLVMVPIASALSQLKWNHFRKPARLCDFQIIDDASRTVFGSFVLLIRRLQM